LTAAIDGYLAAGEPLCLLFDGDVARLVGKLIDEALAGHRPVITVDGIDVAPFDFVDVGAVLQPSGTVPITIKSLLFH
jgi:ethanolamine utilization protein EutA